MVKYVHLLIAVAMGSIFLPLKCDYYDKMLFNAQKLPSFHDRTLTIPGIQSP